MVTRSEEGLLDFFLVGLKETYSFCMRSMNKKNTFLLGFDQRKKTTGALVATQVFFRSMTKLRFGIEPKNNLFATSAEYQRRTERSDGDGGARTLHYRRADVVRSRRPSLNPVSRRVTRLRAVYHPCDGQIFTRPIHYYIIFFSFSYQSKHFRPHNWV